MPRRLTRAQQQEATRAAVLQAAREVFARRGYHAASVSEIADQAGYSHGALYSNFENKESLFLTLYDDYLAWCEDAIEDGSPEDGLLAASRAAADRWMDRVLSTRGFFLLALEFAAYAARNPRIRRRYTRRHSRLSESLGQVLAQRAAEDGRPLCLPAQELGAVVQALGVGLARERLVDPTGIRSGLYGDAVVLLLSAASSDQGASDVTSF